MEGSSGSPVLRTSGVHACIASLFAEEYEKSLQQHEHQQGCDDQQQEPPTPGRDVSGHGGGSTRKGGATIVNSSYVGSINLDDAKRTAPAGRVASLRQSLEARAGGKVPTASRALLAMGRASWDTGEWIGARRSASSPLPSKGGPGQRQGQQQCAKGEVVVEPLAVPSVKVPELDLQAAQLLQALEQERRPHSHHHHHDHLHGGSTTPGRGGARHHAWRGGSLSARSSFAAAGTSSGGDAPMPTVVARASSLPVLPSCLPAAAAGVDDGDGASGSDTSRLRSLLAWYEEMSAGAPVAATTAPPAAAVKDGADAIPGGKITPAATPRGPQPAGRSTAPATPEVGPSARVTPSPPLSPLAAIPEGVDGERSAAGSEDGADDAEPLCGSPTAASVLSFTWCGEEGEEGEEAEAEAEGEEGEEGEAECRAAEVAEEGPAGNGAVAAVATVAGGLASSGKLLQPDQAEQLRLERVQQLEEQGAQPQLQPLAQQQQQQQQEEEEEGTGAEEEMEHGQLPAPDSASGSPAFASATSSTPRSNSGSIDGGAEDAERVDAAWGMAAVLPQEEQELQDMPPQPPQQQPPPSLPELRASPFERHVLPSLEGGQQPAEEEEREEREARVLQLAADDAGDASALAAGAALQHTVAPAADGIVPAADADIADDDSTESIAAPSTVLAVQPADAHGDTAVVAPLPSLAVPAPPQQTAAASFPTDGAAAAAADGDVSSDDDDDISVPSPASLMRMARAASIGRHGSLASAGSSASALGLAAGARRSAPGAVSLRPAVSGWYDSSDEEEEDDGGQAFRGQAGGSAADATRRAVSAPGLAPAATGSTADDNDGGEGGEGDCGYATDSSSDMDEDDWALLPSGTPAARRQLLAAARLFAGSSSSSSSDEANGAGSDSDASGSSSGSSGSSRLRHLADPVAADLLPRLVDLDTRTEVQSLQQRRARERAAADAAAVAKRMQRGRASAASDSSGSERQRAAALQGFVRK